jgi:hypothetical protein
VADLWHHRLPETDSHLYGHHLRRSSMRGRSCAAALPSVDRWQLLFVVLILLSRAPTEHH